jgi:glycosyltransferase involved in cell wall biosynthesis
MNTSISIVMPVHNQSSIIGKIVKNIIDLSTPNVKELLIILDDCTDNSETEILKNLHNKNDDLDVKLIYADNIFEVKACNIGFKTATCSYILNIQDDMVIEEIDFDKKFLKPFSIVPELISVSARDAVDVGLDDYGNIKFYNMFGKDAMSPKGILGIRDIVNRGPILFDHKKLEELNYLDEDFAPITQDDTDLGLRAYRKGYLSGAYMINYYSPLEWGWARKNLKSAFIREQAEKRNMGLLIERHLDLILDKKHGKDIVIE